MYFIDSGLLHLLVYLPFISPLHCRCACTHTQLHTYHFAWLTPKYSFGLLLNMISIVSMRELSLGPKTEYNTLCYVLMVGWEGDKMK